MSQWIHSETIKNLLWWHVTYVCWAFTCKKLFLQRHAKPFHLFTHSNKHTCCFLDNRWVNFILNMMSFVCLKHLHDPIWAVSVCTCSCKKLLRRTSSTTNQTGGEQDSLCTLPLGSLVGDRTQRGCLQWIAKPIQYSKAISHDLHHCKQGACRSIAMQWSMHS